MEIPVPPSQNPDIFTLGYDRSLNKAIFYSPSVVYDSIGDATAPESITPGPLAWGASNTIFIVDPTKGVWLGNQRYENAPFAVSMQGDLRATSGKFTGDITGATGTFSGTVSVNSLNIPDTTTTPSFHVKTNGGAFGGANVANEGSALWNISAAGEASFSNISITGTSGTVLVTDSNIMSSFVAYENITAGNAVSIGDGTQQDFGGSTSTGSTTNFDTTNWVSQKLTTSAGTYSIHSLMLQFTNLASNATVTVSIRADSGGQPTGADLGSKADAMAPVSGQHTFTFASPITVTPSTDYHIVIRVTAGATPQSVDRGNSAGQGNNTSANSGSTWAASNGPLYFSVFQIDSAAGQIGKSSGLYSVSSRANTFIGFAYETKTAGQACRVMLGPFSTGLSGLTPGSVYYLSNTYGAVATSAGTVSRKIGPALSSTKILIKHDNV